MYKISSFDSNCSVYKNFIEYNNANSKIISSKPIPRGAGLSPRLLSASDNYQSIIITDKLSNHNFDFDLLKKTVSVNANYTFAEINKAAFSFGLELPVIGYSSIQIGAGIASCIHGKNHYLYDFGHKVISIELLLFSNEIIFCSDEENSEIFDLTIGGYGSTGLILSAKLELKEISSTTTMRQRYWVNNFEDSISHFNTKNVFDYTGVFGWHNLHCNKKSTFGRGFVYKDTSFDKELFMPENYPNKPAHQYNPSSLYIPGKFIFGKFFNHFYEFKEKKNSTISKFNNYSEAISSKNIYWSIMRVNGFIEVQFIVPYSNIQDFIIFLEKLIKKFNAKTSVCITKPACVEKKFLRFRNDGLNIDITGIKNSINIKFFHEINKCAKSFNAIPNISKCSILSIDVIKECYGNEFESFHSTYEKSLNSKPPEWFLKNGLINF